MTRLLIIGGGELGRQVAHWAQTTGKHAVTGFVDDNMPVGELTDGLPVLGGIADVPRLYDEKNFDEAFIAIGLPGPRSSARDSRSLYARLPSRIDCSANDAPNLFRMLFFIIGANSAQ